MTPRPVPWTAVLAAGAFFLTLAALMRFPVQESVLLLPREQDRTYRLATADGAYFDPGTLVSRTGATLVAKVTLRGDTTAGDERTGVWTEFTSIETGQGRRIGYHERRSAFDRRTAAAVDCCGGYVDSDAETRQSGLAFRLPPGAEPRSYPMYDTVLRRAVTLRFEREEDVRGLRTHRYGYTAGPVEVEARSGEYPGRAMGLPDRRVVGVSRYAEVTRTLWVEPESGLTVKVEERHRQALRTIDGVERKLILQARLTMVPEDVAAQVEEARAFARRILLLREVMPGGLLVLGAALGLLALRLRRPRPPAAREAGETSRTETETG
ncbi:DUF3068 domain-containing protein [Planomonospora sp. ID82291]|uniref:DUF3068 domain-containing protein n=1 Tax=Planomonospora sp. ID82291 TaxID=2738136 RepID=UPI0018C4029D|nr:DUF3068 domain-containing protein [Planomonospora sp. ID82291]MBG0813253.1 DUF3068 domain-containing protein [Planomonospora sp. ID82291]